MVSTTLWINGRFLSRKVTGVERVAHEVLKELAASFLDTSGKFHQNGHEWVFKLVLEKGVEVSIPPYLAGWEVQRIGRWRHHLWEQLDLACFSPADWVLNLCNTGPLLRKRQILFFHDVQVYAIPHNFQWKFRLWYQLLLNIAGRRSALLFTNSYFSQSEFVRYTGITKNKITVAHLGCDHMRHGAVEIPAVILQKLQGRPYVLAVSSASPNKNFLAILKALALMGDAAPMAVIVGQQYQKVFKNQDASLLDNPRILSAGYVSDAELAGLYQHALCLVYPSFYEGFGLPPLEAMQNACPVVVSRSSALPEVCGAAARYCEPDDPQTIADVLSQLMQAHAAQQLEPIRAASLAHAAQFTWKKTCETLLQTITETTLAARKP